jgi:uncharacterized phiE125 gp8 family phage protein
MGSLVLSTAPTQEPLTIDEVKAFLRIDTDDDDLLLEGLIKAAREYCETVTRRRLIIQTWKYYLEDWPETNYIELPYPPLQSITSVIYTDYALTPTTLTLTTNYVVETNTEPGKVVLAYGQSWPTTTLTVKSPISIIYICGYGTPDDVPQSLKQAMLIDIADMMEHRESYVTQPWQHMPILDKLYWPYRMELIR